MSNTERKKETKEKKTFKKDLDVSPSGVISTDPEKPVNVDESKFNQWLVEMYNINTFSKEDIELMYETFKYQGFDRNDMLKKLYITFPDKKIFSEVVVICALRGPKAAAETKLTNGRTISSYGVPASGGKKTRRLTCARITASTADLAAWFLKKMPTPKRINILCPAWLQFPAAGSIKLPDDLRAQHLEFSQKFSPIIGGEFNESIYMQMTANAYLNLGLDLFGS